MKLLVALGATLALGLALSRVAAPPAAGDGPGAGAMPDTLEVLVLASTADRGEIEPCGCSQAQKGGLARRATLIDSMRGVAERRVKLR